LDYLNELGVLIWQDFDPSYQWNITAVGTVYYISAAFPSAAGCSGTSAFWNGGSLVSTLCATSESSTSSFTFSAGAKAGNYVIYENSPGGDSSGQCVTLVGGLPTIPTAACSILKGATQWQLVTIG